MRRLLAPILILLFLPLATFAQTDDSSGAARLSAVMRIPEVMDLMQEEGVKNGDTLFEEMFPGRSSDGWHKQVEAIYDPSWMLQTYDEAFAKALEGENVEPVVAFFESEVGQRILTLEMTARWALLDDTISDLAIAEYNAALDAELPRLDLIRRYVEVNTLIEQNVEGALNSNYAFMTGMDAAGGLGAPMSNDQIVNEVWAQEAEIRAEAEEWLMSYLLMAYGPLSDEELEAYIDISGTEIGQIVNAALFIAFDEMFNELSYALGQAVGQFSQGEDI